MRNVEGGKIEDEKAEDRSQRSEGRKMKLGR
jgi:hypothetical protein